MMKNLTTDEIIKNVTIVLTAIVIFLLCIGFNYLITKQKARADKIRLERQIEQVKVILQSEEYNN